MGKRNFNLIWTARCFFFCISVQISIDKQSLEICKQNIPEILTGIQITFTRIIDSQ